MAQSAYEERMESVKVGLAKSGGVIKPWMFYSITPRDLKEIWKSGDWIDHIDSALTKVS